MAEITIVGLGGIGSFLAEILTRFEDNRQNANETTITLIDGDSYEAKNKERQSFTSTGRNKAETKKVELESKFRNVSIKSVPAYVDEENAHHLIKSGDTVFLCVDNHKSRKIINDIAKSLEDITIISGGMN